MKNVDGIDEKNYQVRKLKGLKGPVRLVDGQKVYGRFQSLGEVPVTLDQFIHPSDNEDDLRVREIAADLFACLKKRLNARELEVYNYHFVQGYTQQETAVFMLVTQPYVNKILRRIVKKAKTLMKTYEF